VNQNEYKWVKQNRITLLNFCSELKPDDFSRQLDGFGFQSIKEALVHTADCYIAWLGSYVLLKTKRPLTPKENISQISLEDIKLRFDLVDTYLNEVIDTFSEEMNLPIQRHIPWRESGDEISITPMKLLIHTITHEYHHKGQIVSMARHMGYVPPNTDVLGTDD